AQWSGAGTKARVWTESSCRPRAGFLRPRFVYGKRPSFKRLIVELADCGLCLAGLGEFDECESPFFSRFPVQRNRNIGQLADRRKMTANLIFGRVVREISDKKAKSHRHLIEPLKRLFIR